MNKQSLSLVKRRLRLEKKPIKHYISILNLQMSLYPRVKNLIQTFGMRKELICGSKLPSIKQVTGNTGLKKLIKPFLGQKIIT